MFIIVNYVRKIKHNDSFTNERVQHGTPLRNSRKIYPVYEISPRQGLLWKNLEIRLFRIRLPKTLYAIILFVDHESRN